MSVKAVFYKPPTGGSGTVTSIDVSGGTTGLTFTGGPVTTSGVITMSGILGVANGGTDRSSFGVNSVICSGVTGTGAFQEADGASTFGALLTGTGFGNLPSWQGGPGSYTPTYTPTTNVSSITHIASLHYHIGNMVIVSIRTSITATGAGTTVFNVSLPVVSDIQNSQDLIGYCSQVGGVMGLMIGDATNDEGTCTYTATSGSAETVVLWYIYLVT